MCIFRSGNLCYRDREYIFECSYSDSESGCPYSKESFENIAEEVVMEGSVEKVLLSDMLKMNECGLYSYINITLAGCTLMNPFTRILTKAYVDMVNVSLYYAVKLLKIELSPEQDTFYKSCMGNILESFRQSSDLYAFISKNFFDIRVDACKLFRGRMFPGQFVNGGFDFSLTEINMFILENLTQFVPSLENRFNLLRRKDHLNILDQVHLDQIRDLNIPMEDAHILWCAYSLLKGEFEWFKFEDNTLLPSIKKCQEELKEQLHLFQGVSDTFIENNFEMVAQAAWTDFCYEKNHKIMKRISSVTAKTFLLDESWKNVHKGKLTGISFNLKNQDLMPVCIGELLKDNSLVLLSEYQKFLFGGKQFEDINGEILYYRNLAEDITSPTGKKALRNLLDAGYNIVYFYVGEILEDSKFLSWKEYLLGNGYVVSAISGLLKEVKYENNNEPV